MHDCEGKEEQAANGSQGKRNKKKNEFRQTENDCSANVQIVNYSSYVPGNNDGFFVYSCSTSCACARYNYLPSLRWKLQ